MSTQRSGSTWVCDLLNKQDGIACGGKMSNKMNKRISELLINYSYMTKKGKIKTVEWSRYQKSLDNAFAEVCQENPALSIGFKLMYNQIPPQFMKDGTFEEFLRKNKVFIVHLVREAKILKLVSAYNYRHQLKLGSMHNKDANMTEAFRDTPKMPWNNETIDEMLALEDISYDWQRKVHFMAQVQDYYLSYEMLLVKEERHGYIHQVIFFLTKNKVDSINEEDGLLQLHEPLCSDRIKNYMEFQSHERVRGSSSAAACDMIQYQLEAKGGK